MTINLFSALGFDILRDYIALERKLIKLSQALNFHSQKNLIDSDFVTELKSYVFTANITLEVLGEEWSDLFFSNSFYDVANKDVTSRDHTFLNNAQKPHIQRALNTRRLKIIHSIHRVLRLLKESQQKTQRETHHRALKSFGSSVIPFKSSRHINQDFYPISASIIGPTAVPALGSVQGPSIGPALGPALGPTGGYALEHHATQAAIRTPRWIPRLV